MPAVESKTSFAEQLTTALSLKNILFATDFSETSEAALPHATAISRHFGSTLHLAHVLSDTGLLLMTGGVDYVSRGTLYEDAIAEAKDKLSHIAEGFDAVPYRTYVRHGLVWKNLSEIVSQAGIDLIVLGTHGRTGLGKLLLGSVAEDILRHAPCPVLTVGPRVSGRVRLPAFRSKEHDAAPFELDIRQIVFATNFAQNSALVAQTAISLAEEFRARLTLLHVMEDYTQLGTHPGPIEGGIRRLRDLVPLDATLHYLPETMLEFGNAHERILKVALDREADLVVVGARTNVEVGSTHLPWSTTHQVIAKAHCPVLTVRN